MTTTVKNIFDLIQIEDNELIYLTNETCASAPA